MLWGVLFSIYFASWQHVLAQGISVVNGVSMYSSTQVRTAAEGAPTMFYNCAYMPAICENVNQRDPLMGTAGDRDSPINGPIRLHADFDTKRNRRRGRKACPGSWKKSHSCPETSQPPVQARSPGSLVIFDWVGLPLNRNTGAIGSAGWNRIAARDGVSDSGLMWTCDEHPPKS